MFGTAETTETEPTGILLSSLLRLPSAFFFLLSSFCFILSSFLFFRILIPIQLLQPQSHVTTIVYHNLHHGSKIGTISDGSDMLAVQSTCPYHPKVYIQYVNTIRTCPDCGVFAAAAVVAIATSIPLRRLCCRRCHRHCHPLAFLVHVYILYCRCVIIHCRVGHSTVVETYALLWCDRLVCNAASC